MLNIERYLDQCTPAGLESYIGAIAKNFCPYINASSARGGIFYTVVNCETDDILAAEEVIFAMGYALTELLRIRRRTIDKKDYGHLCHNLVFHFSKLDDSEGKALLAWPHWVLKHYYTRVGVLYGKFWKGAVEESKDKRPLPIPPCHILSIREAVIARDPQFFECAEWLRPALEASGDSGQSVFLDLTDFDHIRTTTFAFTSEPTIDNFQQLVTRIQEVGFYLAAKRRAESSLKSNRKRENPKS